MTMRAFRKRTDDFPNPPCAQQSCQADLAVTRVVVDDRELPGTLIDQSVDELGGIARLPESADEDDCTVEYIPDSLGRAATLLVDHTGPLSAGGASSARRMIEAKLSPALSRCRRSAGFTRSPIGSRANASPVIHCWASSALAN